MRTSALSGSPNAGKSTLLSVLTNAQPLIADYPFTTTDAQSRAAAAAGAGRDPRRHPRHHRGGLAGQGARVCDSCGHIERCAALLYLVDLSVEQCPATVRVLQEELASYAAGLAARPRLLVGTKLDLPGCRAGARGPARPRFRKTASCAISSFSREGIDELKKAILGLAGRQRPRQET